MFCEALVFGKITTGTYELSNFAVIAKCLIQQFHVNGSQKWCTNEKKNIKQKIKQKERVARTRREKVRNGRPNRLTLFTMPLFSIEPEKNMSFRVVGIFRADNKFTIVTWKYMAVVRIYY